MGAFEPASGVVRAVLEAVRGLRGWDALTSIGITVKVGEAGCEIDNPLQQVVRVSPRDVAEGLVRLSGDPRALQRWASVLLAGSTFLDLQLEDDPYGQALLDGLWDANENGHVRQGAQLAARELYSP